MKTYIGYRKHQGNGTVACVDVLVEPDGDEFSPRRRYALTHHVRHSPTGFEWGYGGSGPADTARCILLDALGDRAKCAECAGFRFLVYDSAGRDGGDFRAPVSQAELDAALADQRKAIETAEDLDAMEAVQSCFWCADGFASIPYQDFKFAVIARLPQSGFELTEQAVLDWYEGVLSAPHGTETT